MAEHVLEIDKLGIQFEGRWVLRDFSLSLSKGEKVTLTGVSGAGKSTVLRAVLGLVTPDEGVVKIFGTAIDGHRIWELRKYLAYVAQEPDLGIGTAREIIERPFEFKANAALRGNLSRLPELMTKFNLSENLLDAEMSTLSGGEKQRVALVSAILLDRPIILLDEASSALDKDNKQAVAAFFQQASGLTVLSVSHDTEWQSFSNRVIELPGSRGAN